MPVHATTEKVAKVANAIYAPSDWARKFHNLPHNEALGAGAAGVGKSVALFWDPLPQIVLEHERCEKAIDHPYPLKWGASKGWALHLRRTYRELSETIKRSMQWIPALDPHAKFVKDSELMGLGWELSSGYRIQFGHCKDPDDWMMYYGNEYTHLAFDELITFLEEQYHQIGSRLRTDDPLLMKMLKCRAASNPVVARGDGESYLVKDPYWVRRYFGIERFPQGEVTLKKKLKRRDGREEWHTRIYLPGRLEHNPNANFRDQFELTLLAKPKHMRKALLDGDWFHVPDSYFADFWDADIHVCRRFQIPRHWARFRAMDWGFKKRGVIQWYAMDDDENLWCERELSFRGRTAAEVAKDIKEIEKGLGIKWRRGRSPLNGPADSQLWELRGDDSVSKADTMAALGVDWTPADKRSRKNNAQKIAARLGDHDGKSATPGLNIFNTCTQLIRYLPTIQAKPGDPEEPVDGGEDHDFDCCGYACAYASHGRAGLGYTPENDNNYFGDFDDDDQEREREDGTTAGGYSY